jgi:hypothetical protein
LLEENARLYRSREYKEFKIRYINSGRKKIDSNDNPRVGPVPKLTYRLKWAIHSASDLRNELIAAAKILSAESY